MYSIFQSVPEMFEGLIKKFTISNLCNENTLKIISYSRLSDPKFPNFGSCPKNKILKKLISLEF